MDCIIDILNWLSKSSNRKKLTEEELDYITNVIDRCVYDLKPLLEEREREKRILMFVKSLKKERRKK